MPPSKQQAAALQSMCALVDIVNLAEGPCKEWIKTCTPLHDDNYACLEHVLTLRECSGCHCVKAVSEIPREHYCGGCRAVLYCSAACQKAHWVQGHREQCGYHERGRRSHHVLQLSRLLFRHLVLQGVVAGYERRHGYTPKVWVACKSFQSGIRFVPIMASHVDGLALLSHLRDKLRDTDAVHIVAPYFYNGEIFAGECTACPNTTTHVEHFDASNSGV